MWPDEDAPGKREAKKVCPYCESDVELTEAGVIAEKESAERSARWAKEKEATEEDEELVDENELEEALEELKAEFETLTAKDDDSLKESYPEDTYTIRVWCLWVNQRSTHCWCVCVRSTTSAFSNNSVDGSHDIYRC
jgi:tyrosyl-tRNA synthetase